MANDSLAPHQKRSRETLNRLLQATIQMFEEHGLEGATVPKIAAAAGVTPGTLYRRFEDKDALYRAAFLSLLEKTAERNRTVLRPDLFEGVRLEDAVKAVITALLRQYNMQPQLLIALSRFLETHPDKAFRRHAAGLIAENYGAVVKALLVFRQEIAHPDPQLAIRFALLMTVTTIEVRALEKASVWHRLLTLSDEQMEAELKRSFVSYLRTQSFRRKKPTRKRRRTVSKVRLIH